MPGQDALMGDSPKQDYDHHQIIQNPTDQEVFIERGARVAQLVLTKAESIKKYDGQYQDKGVIQ